MWPTSTTNSSSEKNPRSRIHQPPISNSGLISKKYEKKKEIEQAHDTFKSVTWAHCHQLFGSRDSIISENEIKFDALWHQSTVRRHDWMVFVISFSPVFRSPPGTTTWQRIYTFILKTWACPHFEWNHSWVL